jgi:hypothetical protein
MTLSVAQQIVPFAAELAEPRLCGATIGTVMSGLLCGICLARPRRRCRRPLRLARDVLARLTLGGCGRLHVSGGLLALQLAARYRFSAEIAGLFGIVGAVGVLIAPIAGKIADRRGPHTVIGLGSVIMLASWVSFEVWGTIAGLIVGVILLDFGEQGALVSNQHVVYALRRKPVTG